MYFETDSFAEFLVFLLGYSAATAPPHGSLRMDEFIAEKFGTNRATPWHQVVRSEFRHKEFIDACAALGKLIEEYSRGRKS